MFNIDVRKAGGDNLRRLKELEQENALLNSIVTETRMEILRLRRLLIEL